ncbi:MAG: hypothetical protein JWQ04_1765 [Pedosphaera sp.]|nr:hypothetical protein [Pedosphaera sp.]
MNLFMKAILLYLRTLLILSMASSLNAQINLVDIGHTNNGGTAQGIAVSGNYAYLAGGTNGLLIYDVSNPALPVNVGHPHGSNDTGINAFAVALSGNYAFVTSPLSAGRGLFIYDVSNPAAPTNVGYLKSNVFGGGLAILGTNLYFGGDDRVPAMDISNPAAPIGRTNYIPLQNLNPVSLAVTSNYLAMAGSGQFMNIGAFSNGAFSNLVYTNVGASATGVAIAGQYVFVANTGLAPLQAYHVAPSGAVTKAGQITYPASQTAGNGIALSGDYAYLACNAGLRVINVANPTNFVAAGQTSTNYGGKGFGVAVSGRYAYLANGADGLRVFALQPPLAVSPAPGNGLTFSWPAQGSFVLQQTLDLKNPHWETVTNNPTNGQVTLPPPPSNMYYRLLGQ